MSSPEEIEACVPISGCRRSKASADATFNEQDLLKHSGSRILGPGFGHGTAERRDPKGRCDVEGALTEIEKNVWRLCPKLPVVMEGVKRFALHELVAMKACEDVILYSAWAGSHHSARRSTKARTVPKPTK